MYFQIGVTRRMEKTKIANGIRQVKTLAVVTAIGIAFAGCAPQTRTLTFGLENTLSATRFNLFIVNYPSSNPDSSEGNLYTRLRYDDLIFIRTDTSYSAHYQLSISLYSDKEMTESRYSKILDRKITVSKYSQTLSTRMYDGFEDKIIVSPGRYFIGLRLLDLNTNVTSSKEIEYSFRDFFRDSVNISDILLYLPSDSIPIEIVRNPGKPLFADFFVTTKNIPASVPLHVIVKSTEAPTSIDTLYQLNQSSEVQHYHLPVDVTGLESAVYDLRLSVGNESAETSFRILRNEFTSDIAESDNETGPFKYIMTPAEFDSLTIANGEEKRKMLESFWLVRSHGDRIVSDAMQKEFYKRVETSDEQFGTQLMPGWQTDRGRIYILYGKPDRIENHVSNFRSGQEANSPPYEIWYYTSLKLRLIFVDEFRNGDYRLAKTSGT